MVQKLCDVINGQSLTQFYTHEPEVLSVTPCPLRPVQSRESSLSPALDHSGFDSASLTSFSVREHNEKVLGKAFVPAC